MNTVTRSTGRCTRRSKLKNEDREKECGGEITTRRKMNTIINESTTSGGGRNI